MQLHFAFYKCEKLAELKMPQGLKRVGCSAFEYCKKLEVLDFPEGVEDIDYLAFYNCDEVKKISLPSTAKSFYNAGFRNKPKLEKITVAEGNRDYKSDGNCLISLKEKELWAGCPTTVIPSGGLVRRISSDAFAHSKIESLVIPEGVEIIVSTAFEGCKELKRLTLPQSLRSPDGCFDDSVHLETVEAPERFRSYFMKLNPKIKFTATDK